jgi:hypothetical protein
MKPQLTVTNLIAFSITVLGFTVPASAAVIYSTDFTGAAAPTTTTAYVDGTSDLDTLYSDSSSNSVPASGGDPGSFLDFSPYGDGVYLGVAAPSTTQTWTITFDYLNGGTNYDAPQFTVYGLNSGDTISGQNMPSSTGTALGTVDLASYSSTTWTPITISFTVPTGYNEVGLEWVSNSDVPTEGIDNLFIDNGVAAPEPTATAFLLLGAIGLTAFLRRRHLAA